MKVYGKLINTVGGEIVQPVVNISYASSGTYLYTVPEKIRSLEFQISGAGGGNGGSDTYYRPPNVGGVGGRGERVTVILAVTPGDIITITVGAAGARGASGSFKGDRGKDGSPSSITHLGVSRSARGGGGGGAAVTYPTNGSNAGNGLGSPANTDGRVVITTYNGI